MKIPFLIEIRCGEIAAIFGDVCILILHFVEVVQRFMQTKTF